MIAKLTLVPTPFFSDCPIALSQLQKLCSVVTLTGLSPLVPSLFLLHLALISLLHQMKLIFIIVTSDLHVAISSGHFSIFILFSIQHIWAFLPSGLSGYYSLLVPFYFSGYLPSVLWFLFLLCPTVKCWYILVFKLAPLLFSLFTFSVERSCSFMTLNVIFWRFPKLHFRLSFKLQAYISNCQLDISLGYLIGS